jgi:hypothetical protein
MRKALPDSMLADPDKPDDIRCEAGVFYAARQRAFYNTRSE